VGDAAGRPSGSPPSAPRASECVPAHRAGASGTSLCTLAPACACQPLPGSQALVFGFFWAVGKAAAGKEGAPEAAVSAPQDLPSASKVSVFSFHLAAPALFS
jgi:hypothetical protein